MGWCITASAVSLPPSLFKPEWVLPVNQVPASSQAQPLPTGPRVELGALTYTWQGRTKTLAQFLDEGQVKAFLVLHRGRRVYEHVGWRDGDDARHQSWSMAKQVLSALVGIALNDKVIASIDDPMDRYAPALAANGFKGVTIRQALLMSSGVGYSEDKARYDLFMNVIADRYTWGYKGRSLTDHVLDPALWRTYTPGSAYEYASITSQALALALEGATGTPLHRYLHDKLWQPLGMTDPARVLSDRQGRDFALCCLYASARSYAVLGQLYAQGGQWQGRQIVPAAWVRRSTSFDDPGAWRGAQVPRTGKTMDLFGFAYHWWPLEGGRDDYTALGIQGQSIYVSPRQQVVVVRLSRDFRPGGGSEEAALVARAVADRLAPRR